MKRCIKGQYNLMTMIGTNEPTASIHQFGALHNKPALLSQSERRSKSVRLRQTLGRFGIPMTDDKEFSSGRRAERRAAPVLEVEETGRPFQTAATPPSNAHLSYCRLLTLLSNDMDQHQLGKGYHRVLHL